MKKIVVIAVVGLFVFASCKKDYTCDCSVSGQTLTISLNDYKKKDAESACDDAETTYKNADANASCTLK